MLLIVDFMFIKVGFKACNKYFSGTFTIVAILAFSALVTSCDQIKADMEYRKKLVAELSGGGLDQKPKSSTESGVKQSGPDVLSKNNIKKRTRPIYNKVILSRMQSADGQQQINRDAVLLDTDQAPKDIGITTNIADKKDIKNDTTVANNIIDPAIQNTDKNKEAIPNAEQFKNEPKPKPEEDFKINPKAKDAFKNNGSNSKYQVPDATIYNEAPATPQEENVDINIFKDKDKRDAKPVIREVKVERVSSINESQEDGVAIDSTSLKTAKKSAKSYSVQAGSFALRDEANTFADKLFNISPKIYVQDAKVKDDKVYRVKIGPFNNQKQANEAMLKAIRSGYYDVFIVENN